MYFGYRRIRSAGRTSGSVELTLPAQLQALQEIECRLTLRDGVTPEIVIQPDLSVAYSMLQQLWLRLRTGLSAIDEIGDFDPSEFTLALMLTPHWQQRPPLAYVDALIVLRRHTSEGGLEATARLISSMAVVAGYRLGLEGELALAFGDVVAYLVLGVTTQAGLEYERGLAQQIYGEPGVTAGSQLDESHWQTVAPGLRRVWEQFEAWQRDPESYIPARQHWYRALQIEFGTPHVDAERSTIR
jgi:hypothetical protein